MSPITVHVVPDMAGDKHCFFATVAEPGQRISSQGDTEEEAVAQAIENYAYYLAHKARLAPRMIVREPYSD